MWAITTYFNPAGYESKLRNFKAFHALLGLPLVVVELVLPGHQSELASYLSLLAPKNTIHVTVLKGDVMWQKERLLNVALRYVPDDAKYIVWIDNDLIFPDASWIYQLEQALEKHPLVQCFKTVRHLPSGVVPADLNDDVLNYWTHERSGFSVMNGGAGYVWAGRSDLLHKHGFYDAMIVGGGDLTFLRAAAGYLLDSSEWAFSCRFTPAHVSHCDAWGRAFYQDVKGRGSLGCLDTPVYHLWHGDFPDRRYFGRQHMLADHAFDPNHDIRINESGAWSWNSDKPGLHAALRDYFAGRREDGQAGGAVQKL
jgi:hypothetical protein